MCTVSLSSFPCSLPMADFDELGESETGDSQLLQLEANIQRKEETIADTKQICDAVENKRFALRVRLAELRFQLDLLQPIIQKITPVFREASQPDPALTKQKLGEIHRLQHPAGVLQQAVGLLYSVLECRELTSTSEKGARPGQGCPLALPSWPELQRFLGQSKLFQQIHHFSARHLAACPDVLQFLCTAYLGLRYGPCPDHPTRPPTFEELSEALLRNQTTQLFGTCSRRSNSLGGFRQLPRLSIVSQYLPSHLGKPFNQLEASSAPGKVVKPHPLPHSKSAPMGLLHQQNLFPLKPLKAEKDKDDSPGLTPACSGPDLLSIPSLDLPRNRSLFESPLLLKKRAPRRLPPVRSLPCQVMSISSPRSRRRASGSDLAVPQVAAPGTAQKPRNPSPFLIRSRLRSAPDVLLPAVDSRALSRMETLLLPGIPQLEDEDDMDIEDKPAQSVQESIFVFPWVANGKANPDEGDESARSGQGLAECSPAEDPEPSQEDPETIHGALQKGVGSWILGKEERPESLDGIAQQVTTVVEEVVTARTECLPAVEATPLTLGGISRASSAVGDVFLWCVQQIRAAVLLHEHRSAWRSHRLATRKLRACEAELDSITEQHSALSREYVGLCFARDRMVGQWKELSVALQRQHKAITRFVQRESHQRDWVLIVEEARWRQLTAELEGLALAEFSGKQ
eukprot:RCo013314